MNKSTWLFIIFTLLGGISGDISLQRLSMALFLVGGFFGLLALLAFIQYYDDSIPAEKQTEN
jgi:hypothetical protein